MAGIFYGNWSSCSTRVNQEIKTEGPLGNSDNGPRWNEMNDNPNGAIAMGRSSYCELFRARVLLTASVNVYK